MSGAAVLSILLGLIIIAARAPLIFWPGASRDFWLKIFSRNYRIRLMGLLIGGLGIAMIAAARGLQEPSAQVIFFVGCFLVFVMIFPFLIFASIFKIIAEAVLEGMDDLILRGVGVLSMFFGGFFIYLGLYLL